LKKIIHTILNKFGYEIYNKSKVAENALIRKWQFLKNITIDTIIDVGANEGQFVEEILDIFPRAEIYSFEPLKDCYQKLELKFKNNNNVHINNFALGEKTGEIVFHRSSASPSSSILQMSRLHKKLFPYTADLFEEKVNLKRLDEVLSADQLGNSVLLKIDVQGAEEQVIKGSAKILQNMSVIITEVSYASLYDNQPLVRDIIGLLGSNGFKYIGNLEQFVSPITNAPLFADAIFVNNEIYKKLYKP
jgi:FkbM family methyltransferase